MDMMIWRSLNDNDTAMEEFIANSTDLSGRPREEIAVLVGPCAAVVIEPIESYLSDLC